jgi:hypothetical protein
VETPFTYWDCANSTSIMRTITKNLVIGRGESPYVRTHVVPLAGEADGKPKSQNMTIGYGKTEPLKPLHNAQTEGSLWDINSTGRVTGF